MKLCRSFFFGYIMNFRKENMIAPVCTSSVIGFGPFGYHLAMLGMLQIMNEMKAAHEVQKKAQATQE